MEKFSDKIDETHRQEIDLIIKRMKPCPKDFECVTTKFESLCKSKDALDNGFIQCAEVRSDCNFRETSPENHFVCRCPLRIYLWHKFEG